jgi:16S rRNA (cytidine1402-2'-O)-methyltransferase
VAGRLKIVATPIGNLEDISLRALKALKAAPIIAAEDTRVAKDRLSKWEIFGKKLISCWDQNEAERAEELLGCLKQDDVCLISDAGMPLISDPGYRVVQACLQAGIEVEVIPGPCAVVTALAGSGLATDRFYFGGFLPREDASCLRLLAGIAGLEATLVFYESPLRLATTLQKLHQLWPERRVVVARNLTQAYEQWLRGTARQVLEELGEETRGEVCLLIEGGKPEAIALDSLDSQIEAMLTTGISAREVRDRLEAATGLPKRELYQRILAVLNNQ